MDDVMGGQSRISGIFNRQMKADDPETVAHFRQRVQQRRLAVGYLLAGLGAAMFSSKAIFIKFAYMDRPDAAMLLALRMLFALPFFFGIGLAAHAKRKAQGLPAPNARTLTAAVLSGFIGYYLAAILDFEALTHITAQLERLVLFSYPLFVMILGTLFFSKPMTVRGTTGALVTYGGLALVFHQGLKIGGIDTLIGMGLVLGAALAFALYQLLAQGFIAKMGSMLFTSIALTAAGLASVLHYWVASGSLSFPVSGRFILIAAALAIFATVLPSFLVNAGLARIGPQATAMISTLSPLITIFLAVGLLDEPFTLIDAVGTLLVIAGIGYYTLADMRAQRLVTGE
jgi:drug/metabolite transporter (DMT)-like permease